MYDRIGDFWGLDVFKSVERERWVWVKSEMQPCLEGCGRERVKLQIG